MARARHDDGDSEGERKFISTITLEIFEVAIYSVHGTCNGTLNFDIKDGLIHVHV